MHTALEACRVVSSTHSRNIDTLMFLLPTLDCPGFGCRHVQDVLRQEIKIASPWVVNRPLSGTEVWCFDCFQFPIDRHSDPAYHTLGKRRLSSTSPELMSSHKGNPGEHPTAPLDALRREPHTCLSLVSSPVALMPTITIWT